MPLTIYQLAVITRDSMHSLTSLFTWDIEELARLFREARHIWKIQLCRS